MNGTPFRGIFYSLGKHYPKVSIDKLVNVTPSSTFEDRGKAIYVIDPHFTYTNQENWISESIINSSLQFTFLRDKLLLTSYAIKARTEREVNLPYEWVFEGSNNEENWTLLHYKEKGEDLNKVGKIGRYNCNAKEYFRSFKITQLGTNMKTNFEGLKYVFALNKLEVYGKLDIEFIAQTCKRRIRVGSSPLIYTFIHFLS